MKQIFLTFCLTFIVLLELRAQLLPDSLQTYSWQELAAKVASAQKAENHALMEIYAEGAYIKGKAVLQKGDSSLARLIYYRAYVIDYVLEKPVSALSLYEQAAAWQRASGAPAYDLAMTLMAMGDCYDVSLGEPKKAKNYYQEALALLEPEHSRYLIDYALLLFYVGNTEEQLGNLEKAKVLYKKALGFQKKGNQLDYSVSLNSLANLHKTEGNWLEAEQYYLESLAVAARKLGKMHHDYSTSLLNLADLYILMRRLEEAEPLLLEAQQIDKKTLGLKALNYGITLIGLARFYSLKGEYAKVRKYYQEAQIIFSENNKEESVQYAGLLLSMAGNAEFMKDYAVALDLCDQAIQIYQKLYPANHHLITTSLMRKANVLTKQRAFGQALVIYQEAAARYEEALGEQHYYRLTALNRMGINLLELGQYVDAWEILEELMKRNGLDNWQPEIKPAYFDEMRDYAFPASNYVEEYLASLELWLALLQQQKALPTKGLDIVYLALDILEKERGSSSQANDQLFFLKETAIWVEKGLGLLKKEEVEEALKLIERAKAVLLLQAQSAPALPKEWQNRKDRLEQKQAELRGAYLNAGAKEQEELLADLNQSNRELNNFRKELAVKLPDLAASYYQTKTPKITELQAALTEEMALVDYFMGQEKIYLLYIHPKESRFITLADHPTDIAQELSRLHKNLSYYQAQETTTIQKAKKNYIKLAEKLGKSLLGFLPNDINQVVILADAELSTIPFGLLLSEKPQSTAYSDLPYYLKRYAISYNYSAALWLENKKAGKRKNNGLILGLAASYKGAAAEQRAPKAQNWRSTLQELPAAKEEINRLSQYYQGDFFVGNLATESRFKAIAKDYAVLHLAMHGLLDDQKPSLSALAFTEDNDSSENNFLQAYEIAQMQLNADLVVLSACQTGQGRFERGNGTASLARAFMYAGSPALLVSLWQVNDQSTAYIMHTFYDQLAQGKNKAEALRQAKLKYLEDQPQELAKHPNLWSAFILLGDEKSLVIREKNMKWSYILWSSPFLLLALFILLRKKNR